MDDIKVKEDIESFPSEPNAGKENQAIESRDYARKEEKEKTAHWLYIRALRIIGTIVISGFSAMLVIWFIHILSPWSWLDENGLVEIRSILLGIVLGGAGNIITRTFFESR